MKSINSHSLLKSRAFSPEKTFSMVLTLLFAKAREDDVWS